MSPPRAPYLSAGVGHDARVAVAAGRQADTLVGGVIVDDAAIIGAGNGIKRHAEEVVAGDTLAVARWW